MKKALKIFFASLASLYALAQGIQLAWILTHSTGNVYQASKIGGALAGLAIGLAIAFALFQSAFKKTAPTESSQQTGRDDTPRQK